MKLSHERGEKLCILLYFLGLAGKIMLGANITQNINSY